MTQQVVEGKQGVCKHCGEEILYHVGTNRWYHRTTGHRECVAVTVAEPLEVEDETGVSMSERTEYCSCQSIHAAHTWGGQPVRYCPGVLRDEDSNNVCRGHGGDGLPENCRICRPPAPAAPEAPPCLHPSLSYQGNGVYTCAECGQHGSESFLEQESARRQSQAGLARAESELAALQAENQRLREALELAEKYGFDCHTTPDSPYAAACEICQAYRKFCAALAEKGSKS